MTEKKTFKITGTSDGQLIHEVDDDWYACCGHVFDMDEWDMEVTFTKKPKPPKFKPGDRVDTYDAINEKLSGNEGTVVVPKGSDRVRVVWDIQPDYIGNWAESDLVLVG